MAIKHGTLSAPGGLSFTGALIHEIRTRIEDVISEVMTAAGAFSDGKSIRKKGAFTVSGEGLSTLALPTVGGGTAADSTHAHVDSTEMVEKAEGAADFNVDCHYYDAGAGNYA